LAAKRRQRRTAPGANDVAAIQEASTSTRSGISTFQSNLKSYLDLSRIRKAQRGAMARQRSKTGFEAFQLPKTIVPELPPDTKYLIFGARSFRGDPANPNVKAFNSAFLIDSEGRVLGHYHKQILLAFGEYIPFVSYLASVPGVPAIGQGLPQGRGRAPSISRTESGSDL
jgi:hypothetical protein